MLFSLLLWQKAVVSVSCCFGCHCGSKLSQASAVVPFICCDTQLLCFPLVLTVEVCEATSCSWLQAVSPNYELKAIGAKTFSQL